ncbi:hypothetical protein I601_0134 [Nocardioides dokdonensis FR1436]|uniref:Winged helix-turn-helix domain-containing protein n=1 Tax=Nocardioides dokdonensis FR1436 TaxID=1300347 RepID=A0A1A9GEA7_9ACTN|nr:crosslink repair DNA glycosylase YcaQ family protein [Nocardioides dokdonensis]ANH36588.1 hypothetical protein I601_0134 [Nocardioides dokdonensis FR1436]
MPPSTQTLSRPQARRIALAAQGFCDPPHATPTMRTLDRALARTGVLQVDSVNVLQRAHYMPLYSRMGPYDTDLLHRAAERRPRRVVEYWAHVQAFMPVDLWPVMQHRMADHRARRGKWRALAEEPALEARVLAAVEELGAATSREVAARLGEGPAASKEQWGWNWSTTRRVLDYLFTVGDLAIASRNSQFEIRYDLPERVLPPEVLAAAVPDVREAAVELVRRAARSHGVATERCLADYYRMRAAPAPGLASAREAVATLVETGELEPVRVEGWSRPAYLHRDARLPRRVGARTLLSPFDPVVWERERTERIFDFRYRIEIYTPAAQRVHGYYVLPFLLGDRLVARVDLKADRRAPGGVLVVQASHAEPGAPAHTAEELLVELRRLAGWLGLQDLRVEPCGDLAPRLGALQGPG